MAEESENMLAWELFAYKTDVRQLETAIPKVKSPFDVLVKVTASSVNQLDVMMIDGYGQVFLNTLRRFDNWFSKSHPSEFPLILGRDFVGIVVAKGKSVGNDINVGDTVMGVTKPNKQGSHAQYVLVSDSLVIKKPANITDEKAAGLLYAGITAWSALKVSGGLFIRRAHNKKVLVLGGSGGVGNAAIQLLKAWGAFVVTTCSKSAIPLCQSLKPDVVVDYTEPDFMQQLKTNGPYDIILDAAGIKKDDIKNYTRLLKSFSFATFITLTPPVLPNTDAYGFFFGNLKNVADLFVSNVFSSSILTTGTIRWGFFIPFQFALRELVELAEQGRIVTVVDNVYKFSETPKAYEKVKEGHLRGKVIIRVNEQ